MDIHLHKLFPTIDAIWKVNAQKLKTNADILIVLCAKQHAAFTVVVFSEVTFISMRLTSSWEAAYKTYIKSMRSAKKVSGLQLEFEMTTSISNKWRNI